MSLVEEMIRRATERQPYGTVTQAPRDQFEFVGDGPWYRFEWHDWYRFPLERALSYFEGLREAGCQVERRSKSYKWTDGSTQYYEEFLVKLPTAADQEPR